MDCVGMGCQTESRTAIVRIAVVSPTNTERLSIDPLDLNARFADEDEIKGGSVS